nr:hypothetical protein [Endozoicomonas sp.]
MSNDRVMEERLTEIEKLLRQYRQELLLTQEKNIRLERELILVMGKVEEYSAILPKPEVDYELDLAREEQREEYERKRDLERNKREVVETIELKVDSELAFTKQDIEYYYELQPKARNAAIMLARGYTTGEMERITGVTNTTVRSRIGRLMVRFGTKNKNQLALKLRQIFEHLKIDIEKEVLYETKVSNVG